MADRAHAKCPKCGEDVEPGFAACWNCQARIPVSVRRRAGGQSVDTGSKIAHPRGSAGRCPICGEPVRPGDEECRNCEAPLAEPATRSSEFQPAEAPKRRSAKIPGMRKIVIGFILVVIWLLTLGEGAREHDPQLGAAVAGGMVLFSGPGSLLIYFGMRSRFKARSDSPGHIEQASMLWMIPGFIVWTTGFFLGIGWLWALVAAVLGLGVVFLVSSIEAKLEMRALSRGPHFQRAMEYQTLRLRSDTDGKLAELAPMIRLEDVEGLRRAFSLSSSWQERELIAAALGNVCQELRAKRSPRLGELTRALTEIVELCRADASGGSYRENCIEHAEMLLKSLTKTEQ